jgi:hypothetical protein
MKALDELSHGIGVSGRSTCLPVGSSPAIGKRDKQTPRSHAIVHSSRLRSWRLVGVFELPPLQQARRDSSDTVPSRT